ncbi:hypothetical protein ACSBR1_008972 [Camellia fascicularis]
MRWPVWHLLFFLSNLATEMTSAIGKKNSRSLETSFCHSCKTIILTALLEMLLTIILHSRLHTKTN